MLPSLNYCNKLFLLITVRGKDLRLPHSILRMRVQRNEVAWSGIRFESKTQSTKTYRDWMTEALNVPAMADILAEVW